MFKKRIRPRRFDYTPLHYKSEQDSEEGGRIQFKRFLRKPASGISIVKLLIVFFLVLVAFLYFRRFI